MVAENLLGVATMIADQIDQRDRTSACVVGVNHDSIICL